MPKGFPKKGKNKGWFSHGHKPTNGFRKGMKRPAKSYSFLSGEANLAKKKEVREKISLAVRGENNGMFGKKHSKESIKKNRDSNTGVKNGMWQGGISIPHKQYNLKRKEKIAGRKRSKKCEICSKRSKTCFDHDHATGLFRGWICRRCNIALGFVEDDIKLLSKMIEYLIKNKNK